MGSLIYFALWAGLFFLMMRFGCGAHIMGHRHRHHGSDDKHAPRNSERMRWVPPETDVDPVCRKSVRTDQGKSSVYDGMVYYFCSRECRERFEDAPQLFAGPTANPQPNQKDQVHG